MLEVFPIQAKEEQKSICDAIGAKYLENTRAYIAVLDEKPIAICQFALTDEGGEIHSVDALPSADFRTLFVLARATLSFIELCGKDHAFFLPEEYDEKLIEEIGFVKDSDNKLKIDLI